METRPHESSGDAAVLPVVPEVITLLDRLRTLFLQVRKRHLPHPTFGGYCVINRVTGHMVAAGILGNAGGKRKEPEILGRARELAEWLYNNDIYVTSGAGNYHLGAIRLDRYILAVVLDPSVDLWADALVVATAQRETNLPHSDHVAAIQARHNHHMNDVLDLALYI